MMRSLRKQVLGLYVGSAVPWVPWVNLTTRNGESPGRWKTMTMSSKKKRKNFLAPRIRTNVCVDDPKPIWN